MKDNQLHHINALKKIIGDAYVITDTDAKTPFIEELRGFFSSDCMAVILPENTLEISKIVEYCQQEKIAIVPQGGNTGTVGGAVATAEQIILNLTRMNKIRDFNPVDNTMTVEAGCILEEIQNQAANKNRFFPLSLAAQGSCQIGGNLATNAGGINVLKYGNTRDLVTGIEAVMADGSVLDLISDLRKNNTGYDLKNLLIGSEGTLGIITAATVKLFYPIRSNVTAWIGLDDISTLPALKEKLELASQQNLITFELMSDVAVDLVAAHFKKLQSPLSQSCKWHILIVAASLNEDNPFEMALYECLERGMQDDIIKDVAVAQNERQENDFLSIREHIPEAQKLHGKSIKNDISIPINSIINFVDEAQKLLYQINPRLCPCIFGHIGDGNLHFNVGISEQDESASKQLEKQVHDEINALVDRYLGSFSAEHGVGLMKKTYMQQYKDPVAIAVMKNIKQTLDPNNLLNPGKTLPDNESL